MWAMATKEFRELRRDRRTLALMIVVPLLLLIVFGYAARFDVERITTLVVGPNAAVAEGRLPEVFDVVDVRPGDDRADAVEALRRAEAAAAVVATDAPEVLLDGGNLFAAEASIRALAAAAEETPGLGLDAGPPGAQPSPGAGEPTAAEQVPGGAFTPPKARILFNPGLETSAVMIPGIAGMILVFVGTIITSLGVVRERQAGTLEQLAVMPFRPRDVFIGKIAPYFLVGALDLAVVLTVGVVLFDVPFRGSVLPLALGALLFLFVALGMGVLISTVSENQGQAIQLAILTLLPQIMFSGMIFPIESMAAGVRWISYFLPLTYFVMISRGVMLRGAPIEALWFPLVMLAVLGLAIFGLAVARFRRDLAPARSAAEAVAA